MQTVKKNGGNERNRDSEMKEKHHSYLNQIKSNQGWLKWGISMFSWKFHFSSGTVGYSELQCPGNVSNWHDATLNIKPLDIMHHNSRVSDQEVESEANKWANVKVIDSHWYRWNLREQFKLHWKKICLFLYSQESLQRTDERASVVFGWNVS